MKTRPMLVIFALGLGACQNSAAPLDAEAPAPRADPPAVEPPVVEPPVVEPPVVEPPEPPPPPLPDPSVCPAGAGRTLTVGPPGDPARPLGAATLIRIPALDPATIPPPSRTPRPTRVAATDEGYVERIDCADAPGCQPGFVVIHHGVVRMLGPVMGEARHSEVSVRITRDGSVWLELDEERLHVVGGEPRQRYEGIRRFALYAPELSDGSVLLEYDDERIRWVSARGEVELVGEGEATRDVRSGDGVVWAVVRATGGRELRRLTFAEPALETLRFAERARLLSGRHDLAGRPLGPEDIWVCLGSEGRARLELWRGAEDAPAAVVGDVGQDCSVRLVHTPGRDAPVLLRFGGGQTGIQRLGGAARSDLGRVDGDVQAVLDTGAALFVVVRVPEFRDELWVNAAGVWTRAGPGSERGARITLSRDERAVSAVFSGGEGEDGLLVSSLDGGERAFTALGNPFSWLIDPEHRIWSSPRVEPRAVVVLEDGAEVARFDGVLGVSALWRPDGRHLASFHEDGPHPRRYRFVRLSGAEAVPVRDYGRSPRLLRRDGEVDWVSFDTSNGNGDAVARWDGEELRVVAEAEYDVQHARDVADRSWLFLDGPGEQRALVFGDAGPVDPGFSARYVGPVPFNANDGARPAWGLQLWSEGEPPCICRFETSRCLGPPRVLAEASVWGAALPFVVGSGVDDEGLRYLWRPTEL